MTASIRMSALDAANLVLEYGRTPMHVAALQTFKIPAKAPSAFVPKLFDHLRSFPVTEAPFNYRLARGLLGKLLPAWEQIDEVDLDRHFRYVALNRAGGQRELNALVSRLHSIPMDMSKPLWEIHLIDGLAGGRFALYSKIHHALVDGIHGVKLFKPPDMPPRKSYVRPVWAARGAAQQPSESRRNSLLEEIPAMIVREASALPSLSQGLLRSAKSAVGLGEARDLVSVAEAPRTMFNATIGPGRLLETQSLSLKRFRAIAHSAGGTINDVVLAVCSGALRRYLDELDQLPDRSLIAAVPFALPHDESEKTGNAVSGLNANLGTNIADVRKRFDSIRRSTEAGKSHLRKMTAVAAQRYMLFMAAPVMLTTLPGFGGQLRPTFNLVITNVPGPKKRLYFHGARMESFYPVIQAGQGLALNIGLISYADRLFFGPIACPDTVPALDKLAAYMADALDELELAYGIATPGKSSKRVGRSQHKKRTARAPSKKK